MLVKRKDHLQLSIDFEEKKVTIIQQTTTITQTDLDELYKFDPDEPWWNR